MPCQQHLPLISTARVPVEAQALRSRALFRVRLAVSPPRPGRCSAGTFWARAWVRSGWQSRRAGLSLPSTWTGAGPVDGAKPSHPRAGDRSPRRALGLRRRFGRMSQAAHGRRQGKGARARQRSYSSSPQFVVRTTRHPAITRHGSVPGAGLRECPRRPGPTDPASLFGSISCANHAQLFQASR